MNTNNYDLFWKLANDIITIIVGIVLFFLLVDFLSFLLDPTSYSPPIEEGSIHGCNYQSFNHYLIFHLVNLPFWVTAFFLSFHKSKNWKVLILRLALVFSSVYVINTTVTSIMCP